MLLTVATFNHISFFFFPEEPSGLLHRRIVLQNHLNSGKHISRYIIVTQKFPGLSTQTQLPLP